MAPFLYPIVYAIISLFIAFILFKYLKSVAKIEKTGYQAGGAIAGFIIVFTILFASYMKLNSSLSDYKSIVLKNERVPYTIIGKVKKLDNSNNDGVILTLYPPSPSKGVTDATGQFTIYNFRASQVDLDSIKEIHLSVDVKGYAVNTFNLLRNKLTINNHDKEISIDTTIYLTPVGDNVKVTPIKIIPDTNSN